MQAAYYCNIIVRCQGLKPKPQLFRLQLVLHVHWFMKRKISRY